MGLKDWKLLLRYGKLKTPYKHYTAIAACIVGELDENFECQPGSAFVSVKTWASSTEESSEILQSIGEQIGYTVKDKIEIFETEAVQPPKDEPYGYDIQFTPYEEE